MDRFEHTLIPPGSQRRVHGMTTKRIIKIKSGVKAGFDPQPDPPTILNMASIVKVIRTIGR